MKEHFRRILSRFPGTLAIALLFVAFLVPARTAGAQQKVKVRLLTSQTTAALPFLYMAREQTVPGVDLEIQFFANHAQALATLLRGDADLLYTGSSQGWQNRMDGSPIVMIDTGIWGMSSLIGRDPSIKGFADLRGKKIAMPFPGSPLDFQSRALLAHEHIDPVKDLTISFGPFPQSVQRLLSGQLDAAALPEPLATTVVEKNGLVRLVEYSKAWARVTGGDPRSPQVSLFAGTAYAASHAALIAAFVKVWDAATQRVVASPEAAAARFATDLATNQAILEEATRNTLLSVPAPAENRDRVLSYFKAVSPYLPSGSKQIDDTYFFIP
jgi:NitT/TauT family transport system substrate-binding protein